MRKHFNDSVTRSLTDRKSSEQLYKLKEGGVKESKLNCLLGE